MSVICPKERIIFKYRNLQIDSEKHCDEFLNDHKLITKQKQWCSGWFMQTTLSKYPLNPGIQAATKTTYIKSEGIQTST